MLLKIIFVFFFLVSFSWSFAIERKGYLSMEMFDKAIAGSMVQQLYSHYTSEKTQDNKQSSINITPAVLGFTGPNEFVEQYTGINFNYNFFNKRTNARYGVIFNLGQGAFSNTYNDSEYKYNNFNGGFFLEKIKSTKERSYLFVLATNKYSENISDSHYTQTMYYGKYINIKDKNISHNVLFQRAFSVELLSFFGFDEEKNTRLNTGDILPRFGDIGVFYSPTFVFFLDKNAYFKLGADFGLYLNGTKHFTIERPDTAHTFSELMERVQDYSLLSLNLFFVFHTGNLDFYLAKHKQGEFDSIALFANYTIYAF